jgi:hypothetical protein
MEIVNTVPITLDFRKPSKIPMPQVHQYDTNEFEFTVIENGTPADLSTVDRIVANYRRPDKSVITREILAVGNVITYPMGAEEMAVEGLGELNVQLFAADRRLSSMAMKIYVHQNLGAAFEGGKGLPLLQELFVEVAGLVEDTQSNSTYALNQGDYAKEQADIAQAESANLSQLKTDAQSATDSANTAAGLAQTNASEAETQGLFAKEQGDYAKAEADRLVGTDVSSLSAQLEQKALQSDLVEVKRNVNDVPFQSSMYSKIPTLNKKVAFPSGFTWTDAPINIFKNDKGEITTDFEAADHKPDMTGLKTYYVSLNGSNSNDGLSESTPFRRVSDPLQKADCGEIIISGGFYPRGQAWAGFSPVRNMTIRAKEGEEVILSASDSLAWSLSSGYTNVYQANRSTVNDVFDARFKNRFGDYAELKNVSSIAEVQSTQGSWYTDGSIIYVHTFDSRPADSYIRAYLNTNNAIITTGNHFYIEGVTFEGGNSNIRIDGSDSSMKVVMKNCKFKYTKLLNCVSVYGAEVYLQNCNASYGNQDGFNYHIKDGVPCRVIEVNCTSHRNGRDGADQNNGSTNHDGGKSIRVNGEYFENHGPNVIDVNEGSESWNLGVVSHTSKAASGVSNSDFKNSNIGKGLMWLDSCISYGSDYSVATAGVGSETRTNNCILNAEIYGEEGTSFSNFKTSYVPVSEYTDILSV